MSCCATCWLEVYIVIRRTNDLVTPPTGAKKKELLCEHLRVLFPVISCKSVFCMNTQVNMKSTKPQQLQLRVKISSPLSVDGFFFGSIFFLPKADVASLHLHLLLLLFDVGPV